MLHPSISFCHITKVNGDDSKESQDIVAAEEPLEIQLEYNEASRRNLKSISVTMRSPGNDLELALGFLFTEGIIIKKSDVLNVKFGGIGENVIQVALHDMVKPDLQKLERHFYTSSSCGVCGKSSIDAVFTVSVRNVTAGNSMHLPSSLICRLPQLLQQRQDSFKLTGGLHASALFNSNGELVLVREDVGRHNALDKLIGAALQANLLPLREHILLLSGRASFELIQKAIMAGIPVVSSVGAPSSLAVQMAKEHRLTLVGFLRDERFNIYAGKERIIINPVVTENT